MNENQLLKSQLVKLLEGKGAHSNFDTAIENIPPQFYDQEIEGVPYTLWQLLEHIRLAQADILDYSINPNYQEPKWPEGYWPKEKGPPQKNAWENSIATIKKDRQNFKSLLENPATDVFAQIPHGKKGHTILREVLLAADHNSYHVGQMILMRRLLGIWES